VVTATERVSTAANAQQRAWDALAAVADPEIPVLTVLDLGIVREVHTIHAGAVEVVLTPTYSGCPATHAIEQDVRRALNAAGFVDIRIRTSLHPAWSTDWISAAGREKLTQFGIAPPGPRASATLHFFAREDAAIACPRCASANTERLAAFGSTACKALYRCRDCREPFDYFKPI
jgi:ring-1,2-phenylacetyl-CoA epoxidase subunit PaaD